MRQADPMTEHSAPAVRVDFWFDPVCPWTWLTAEWLREVARLRPLEIQWHIMSLSVLNEGREMPAEYVELLRRAWRPVRVLTAAQQQHGDEAVGPLFLEIGSRYHRDGRSDDDRIFAESLAGADLPADLLAAADSPEWDDTLRASHAEAMALVGDDVGSPVIRLPDTAPDVAYFGPVVNPVPRGDDALRLWTGIEALVSTPQLYELKRTRTTDPLIEP